MQIQIRDPVHNFIHFNEDEVRLINTKALQRLRGIRQLALAALVYPGALHTRFDHTLGVTHVAGSMALALGLDEDDHKLVRFASLLHDIGHGPFSHVSEAALERYADRGTLSADQKNEKIHEIVTAQMITNDREIKEILGGVACGKVTKLLAKGYGQPVLRAVVSGPLDADKQDYLLRDSRFCGVEYGAFDMKQLHRCLTARGPEDEKELMITPDGVHPIEQYALAKYYMTANVYRHKVRLITDQMIVRAIVLGIEVDRIPELQRLYSFDNSPGFVENYSDWDDGRFMHEFCVARPNSRCGAMMNRLRERRLLKRVFSSRSMGLSSEARDLVPRFARHQERERRAGIEAGIAVALSEITHQAVAAQEVIVHSYTLKSARESIRNDEAGIMIDEGPGTKQFDAVSTLFGSINESHIDEFIEVYAPIDWPTMADKKRVLREADQPIPAIIEDGCSGKVKEQSHD